MGNMITFSLMTIAMILHGTVRVFSQAQGDYSEPPWESLDHVAKEEWKDLVVAVQRDPFINDESLQEFWLTRQTAAGWQKDIATDRATKKHRFLVPYEELSDTEREKWRIITANAVLLIGGPCGPGFIEDTVVQPEDDDEEVVPETIAEIADTVKEEAPRKRGRK